MILSSGRYIANEEELSKAFLDYDYLLRVGVKGKLVLVLNVADSSTNIIWVLYGKITLRMFANYHLQRCEGKVLTNPVRL